MSYRCLTDYLEDLGNAGELIRIEDRLDPDLEVARVVAESARTGGAALLFGAVQGHDLPVVCNLLATEGRIGRALGVASLDEVADRIARLLDASAPESWFERLRSGSPPAMLQSFVPRRVKSAAVQQIVRLGGDIDLGELPMLGAMSVPASPRAVHEATVLTADPDSHIPVTARFDLLPVDRTRLAVCWAADASHARLLGEYRLRGRKMPLAVVIGGDPGFLLAAAAPLPPETDVCAVAGLLREKALDVVACRSVDLEAPAEAEIVLEGFVDPDEPPVVAGPLCGPIGEGAQPCTAPILHVTAVTHRANPIYVAMVPGRPPHEACTVTRAMHRVFRPLARLAMPELADYDLPEFGGGRHWAAASIRKTYAGQGRRAVHAAWTLPAMKFAKVLVLVDDDVDVHCQEAVLAAVTSHVRPGCDVVLERGPADLFDPAATPGILSQKMAFDATRKWKGE